MMCVSIIRRNAIKEKEMVATENEDGILFGNVIHDLMTTTKKNNQSPVHRSGDCVSNRAETKSAGDGSNRLIWHAMPI